MSLRYLATFGHLALGAGACSLIAACAISSDLDEETKSASPIPEALVSVTPPDFATPEIAYYCAEVFPNAGWALHPGNAGDGNANLCSNGSGATTVRTGMYSVHGTNIAEAWCAPNFYWIFEGQGRSPIDAIFSTINNQDASTPPTQGNCVIKVTVGADLRKPIPGPAGQMPPAQTPLNRPAASSAYSFDVAKFASKVNSALALGTPTPVGYQLAVRDPQGKLVYSEAFGSVTGSSGLQATNMTSSRRIDMASASKTLTATAMVAAFEDLATLQPTENSLGLTLDSSIVPYLPSDWTVAASVKDITFRMVLRHTSGFCGAGASGGDSYAEVRSMIQSGASSSQKGSWVYCNGNYALLRILIPYVVDGPAAYKPFESDATLNAKITALSYRNYVKGRLLAPLGIAGADDFYTGPLPETIYFDGAKNAVPDKINIRGNGGYDQTANNMVLKAGSGNWTMSASEMSLFISSLWRGKLVSNASLTTMIAQANNVGIGNYGSHLTLPDGTVRDNLNENGGGGAGGPAAQWVTFFNGYTAVLLSNTTWGSTLSGVQLMEQSFRPALTPSSWTCNPNFYNNKDGCDCNCGTRDPDCDVADQALLGCSAGQVCNSKGVCAP